MGERGADDLHSVRQECDAREIGQRQDNGLAQLGQLARRACGPRSRRNRRVNRRVNLVPISVVHVQ